VHRLTLNRDRRQDKIIIPLFPRRTFVRNGNERTISDK